MRMDPKVEPIRMRPKTERPADADPVLWTPWGPQNFSERDAQMAACRRLVRKVEKLRSGKLTLA